MLGRVTVTVSAAQQHLQGDGQPQNGGDEGGGEGDDPAEPFPLFSSAADATAPAERDYDK